MAVKITFGIQPKMLERIEKVSKYWDSKRQEEDMEILKDGWIKYDRTFWKKLGEEFGWDAFTLALHYFKYLNKTK